jgi:transcriptional regulator with XRE-family HTH domain
MIPVIYNIGGNYMQQLRLRELRDEYKMTQQEVANRLRLTRDAYSLYELGKRQMNYETLCLLADIYNVSIDYLLGRYASSPVLLNDGEFEVIKQYRLLDKRGQDAIKVNLLFEMSQTHKKAEVIKKSAV